MKNPFLASLAALLAGLLVSPAHPLSAADDTSAPAKKATIKTALKLSKREIGQAARAWQRIFGEEVTIADRAKSHLVTVDISSFSKDEFRTMYVAALRENGIHVIERTDGVLFDTEPPAKMK